MQKLLQIYLPLLANQLFLAISPSDQQYQMHKTFFNSCLFFQLDIQVISNIYFLKKRLFCSQLNINDSCLVKVLTYLMKFFIVAMYVCQHIILQKKFQRGKKLFEATSTLSVLILSSKQAITVLISPLLVINVFPKLGKIKLRSYISFEFILIPCIRSSISKTLLPCSSSMA